MWWVLLTIGVGAGHRVGRRPPPSRIHWCSWYQPKGKRGTTFWAHFGAHAGRLDGGCAGCQGSRSMAALTASTITGKSRSTVLRTIAGSTRR